MAAIDRARRLTVSISITQATRPCITHCVNASLNTQMPMKVCSTPRIAEDTICVTGEVTLTESRPAMHIRKPTTPFDRQERRGPAAFELTVMMVP